VTCTCATCPEHGTTPLHAGLTDKQRDIGEAFGIASTNGVCDHLRALKRKGAVLHAPGKSRGWRAA